MRLTPFKVLAVTATLASALAHSASAGECTRIGAVGDGPTKGIATLMSTNGLKNLIDYRGLKGQGPIKTTCEDGTFLSQSHSSQTACK